MIDPILSLAATAVVACLALAALLAVLAQGARLERLRLQGEQIMAAQRGETEMLRAALADTERALGSQSARVGGQLRVEVTTAIGDMRTAVDARLRELREGNEAKLEAIQRTVNEQLHAAVEKQMTTSFQRVTEQFAAVQKAMGVSLENWGKGTLETKSPFTEILV